MLTTPDVFLEKTSLLIDVLARAVLDEKPHHLTRPQVEWFHVHCDVRFRYFHANRPDWEHWLENADWKIDPRDQCKVWIRHWLAAYLLDPDGFQERCATCPLCGNSDNIFRYRHHGVPRLECDACGYKSWAE